MTELLFTDLGLAEPVQRAVQARNHITPTPIQAQAIPKLLKGRDMLGIAHHSVQSIARVVQLVLPPGLVLFLSSQARQLPGNNQRLCLVKLSLLG